MKVYMISEAEMQSLRDSLDLSKFRQVDGLDTHDPKRHLVVDIHRTFNFHVSTWISGVTK